MKILVLLKKTPDTETKIEIASDGATIDHSNTKFIINPYDEFAIEEALQIKEKVGQAEVVIASFGDASCKDLIVKGLAMGADRGVLVSNDGLDSADSLAVAKVLKAVVESEQASLVLCGKQAIDDDNMHVGTMVAELLDWPHVNVAGKVTIEGESCTVEREVEGGQVEVHQFNLPGVVGANKSLNTPRYTSLPGIMKAKRKPFDNKSLADLGLNASDLSNTVVLKGLEYPAEKPAGQVFQGDDVASMVGKVVELLRDEAKVL
ncbi:electron transfer flavoprotein subunit beta/FixA family protein [Pseudobacteriovorax antillogorgiicola]|uniref:Electron transfer flavoprotein subunit beta n=1 Tax=Pseudobacteriovorax antillogorgiicola TaxID=1513793 RepID=A0A1Y6B9B8_9BACT|nr:electron transfer flavoprotein subunit beta/FixA family protein [Pseudobacteriovorax antillogorgiicola]TCS59417.1 electron transfer flavoprotein beta subunit [Pseudobacteriovorax antillogorgiicola]SME88484.1 electron transfer flavoprotein beta subunit [Pseudobacteriovorax antillogorgiicola]